MPHLINEADLFAALEVARQRHVRSLAPHPKTLRTKHGAVLPGHVARPHGHGVTGHTGLVPVDTYMLNMYAVFDARYFDNEVPQ